MVRRRRRVRVRCETRVVCSRAAKKKTRCCLWDSNPRGDMPLELESSALTTRPKQRYPKWPLLDDSNSDARRRPCPSFVSAAGAKRRAHFVERGRGPRRPSAPPPAARARVGAARSGRRGRSVRLLCGCVAAGRPAPSIPPARARRRCRSISSSPPSAAGAHGRARRHGLAAYSICESILQGCACLQRARRIPSRACPCSACRPTSLATRSPRPRGRAPPPRGASPAAPDPPSRLRSSAPHRSSLPPHRLPLVALFLHRPVAGHECVGGPIQTAVGPSPPIPNPPSLPPPLRYRSGAALTGAPPPGPCCVRERGPGVLLRRRKASGV